MWITIRSGVPVDCELFKYRNRNAPKNIAPVIYYLVAMVEYDIYN